MPNKVSVLVMHYRQLASLGTQAAQEQWGFMPLMRSIATPTALQMAWLQLTSCLFTHLAYHMLVMHYRQLASLGTQAAQEQWGVDPFNEKHCDTHSFANGMAAVDILPVCSPGSPNAGHASQAAGISGYPSSPRAMGGGCLR